MPRSQLLGPVHQIVGKAAQQPRQVRQIISLQPASAFPASRSRAASSISDMAQPFSVTTASVTPRSVLPARRAMRPRLSSFATCRLTVVELRPIQSRQFAHPERSAALG